MPRRVIKTKTTTTTTTVRTVYESTSPPATHPSSPPPSAHTTAASALPARESTHSETPSVSSHDDRVSHASPTPPAVSSLLNTTRAPAPQLDNAHDWRADSPPIIYTHENAVYNHRNVCHPDNIPRRPPHAEKSYVVYAGLQTGIFYTWPQAEARVKHVSSARHKGFADHADAKVLVTGKTASFKQLLWERDHVNGSFFPVM
ncbi:hypothetical protein CONPUDRAFT_160393 [Coniophora puteana RWD-64-598 SS2]|uniref:Ribonuclease H1 N-terminal domain-containing protein n=1 Tax=Coniophora puteana (strain RWD-64-598) TaxID=741705 RepID=R7SDA2_CONPW|nr:uncharacterized protein CONPUDRAFT_160393 [Coniophora puteana RWD-64-598 SS2]EIW74143.1 hypothetical protein CONPUDRAFT_160393 [Coniophora puteana RWD-64-598 SS2]